MVLRRVKDRVSRSSTSPSPRWTTTTCGSGRCWAWPWWGTIDASSSRRWTRCCASCSGQADVTKEEREIQTFSDDAHRSRLQALGGVACRQRVERVAGEVRAVLGEVLGARRDQGPARSRRWAHHGHPRARLWRSPHARALFTVHGLDEAGLERVREGLDHASGYFRRAIGQRLRMKVAPAVTFEVDRVFEQAARVERSWPRRRRQTQRRAALARSTTEGAGGWRR